MSIAANLERLRNEIADTCARAHRDPSTVALMAVSKMHPAEAILEAHAAGQRLFGENRVQEFAAKLPILSKQLKSVELPTPPEAEPATSCFLLPTSCFHLIGPLQNNKTSKAAEIFHAIDTLDSLKTAERLDRAAAALNKTIPVLIEVKLSPEETKHGIAPQNLPALLHELTTLDHIEVHGLMTVPPLPENPHEGPEAARPYFRQLRRLRDELQPKYPALNDLSMGMSNDFRVAIEEGSSCVRIGTAIFGHRAHP